MHLRPLGVMTKWSRTCMTSTVCGARRIVAKRAAITLTARRSSISAMVQLTQMRGPRLKTGMCARMALLPAALPDESKAYSDDDDDNDDDEDSKSAMPAITVAGFAAAFVQVARALVAAVAVCPLA